LCEATLVEVVNNTEDHIERYTPHPHHNHKPPHPATLKPKKEVMDFAKQQMQSGVKTAPLYTQLDNNTKEPLTARNCPTPKQLNNARTYMKQKEMPTKDIVSNINQKHYPHFAVQLCLFPVRVILIPEQTRIMLANYKGYLLIYGTFEMLEVIQYYNRV
jgi:hypothetical protein